MPSRSAETRILTLALPCEGHSSYPRAMARRILGTLLGIFVAGLVVMVIEGLGSSAFPPDPGFDPAAPDLSLVPMGAIAMVALAWVLGPIAGGLVANLVGRPPGPVPALIIGGLFLAADVANLLMIQSPPWLWVVGLVAPLPGAWGGFAAARSLQQRRAAPSSD